jgi:serine protease Do
MPRPARRPLSIACLAAWLWASCAASAQGVGSRACTGPVPDLYDRVAPSVVYVAATSINPYRLADRVTRVVGSGFIIGANGLILTNSHVAFGRQSIRVTLDSGDTLPAELVGADPIFDLALIRITPPAGTPLPVAKLGDSERLRVGDEVFAIGNPLGLDQTLTRGIVSAINRVLSETPFSLQEPLIQTDASINPGSSGGPLVDRCGDVVGIATAIIPDAQNIGFAIPISLAKTALPSLTTKGRVIRPWLGFHGQLVTDELRDLLKDPLPRGLMVEVVEPGSPAEKAGIHGGTVDLVVAGHDYLVGGDVVTHLEGTSLDSEDRLVIAMGKLTVGRTVRLTVVRSGQSREVEYDLPERPLLPGDTQGRPSGLEPAWRRGRPGAPGR